MVHMCDVLFLFITLSLLEMEGGQATAEGFKPARVTAPGDIIIGGLFPIHKGVEKSNNYSAPHIPRCVGFDIGGFTTAMAMIQAVEAANRSPVLDQLGIRLGYRIHNSCSDVTTALRASADFTQKPMGCGGGANNYTCNQAIMAVIGGSLSEVSIAVARQLNLELIPQISYSSTTIILSDKTRFPAFMRTVPSDLYQTRAMVKLLSDRDWNWVGVVTTDGDYGRSALDSFVSQAMEAGICVAFKEILPDSLTSPEVGHVVKQVASTLRSNTKVKVVVSFINPTHMRYLFQELRGQGMGSGSGSKTGLGSRLGTGSMLGSGSGLRLWSGDRVWVASDNWSASNEVLEELDLTDIGHVVGFTFKSGDLTPLNQYMKSQVVSDNVTGNNSFLEKFFSLWGGVGDRKLALEAINIQRNHTKTNRIFSVEMAVSAIAHAVTGICRTRDCKRPDTVQPWEVLEALHKTQFEQEGKSYRFDKNGDINLGYDITLWRSDKGTVYIHDIMAEYHPNNNSFTYTNDQTRKQLWDLRHVVSKCSDSCVPGEFKKTAEGQHTCCYECSNCTENHYSNTTDMDQCLRCDPEREWSSAGSSVCIAKTLEFLNWNDSFAVVLLTLSALGIVLVLLVGVLFLHQRHTPVVRAAGGWLCQLILVSLAGSFISVPFFVGRPSNLQCKVQQVLYGLSFTLCVSCILVKSLKILLAFQFNPGLKDVLRRLYQPYAIISVCVVLQAITCTLWLVLKSPWTKVTVLPTILRVECDVGSYVAFVVMLGYIAVLALVCFVCAFKGRKLPEKYNEAKFITFGMLLYLISWVIFVPVYATTSGKYLPAVEMVVILISNYGILSCHFLPKCYIILFRRENNTRSAFLQNVYEYSTKGCASLPSIFLPQPKAPAEPQKNLTTLTQNIDNATQSSIDRGFATGRFTQPDLLVRRFSI